ncbi:hypothetical protein PENSPDRAFT_397423 [Peniophora sp. CONT]|nr:hypothetical protein PENSPDRAFT_397423 [Peniophora sp. CONT]
MFSLSRIATFALLALGTAASAVPAKRQWGSTAVEVLDSLADAVIPIAAQFNNATAANVQPIVDQISSLVSEAASNIAALPSGTEGGNSTESLAKVFSAILTPANQLVTTEGIDAASIIPIFTQLGTTLALLLQNVVTLIQEVLELVVDILNGLITGFNGILGNLGLGALTDLGL